MAGKERILIIEKDEKHRKHLERMLEREGYEVIECEQSLGAFEKLDAKYIHLIISDYYLSDIRGKKFYEEITTMFQNIPIIFLSNRADSETIAEILQYPNADYMVKPIVMEELLGRIRAFLRTENNPKEKKIQIDNLVLDLGTYKARINGEELSLSPTEFKLLKYLMQNKGVVLSRRMILNKVWGYSYDVSSRIVDVYIGYLREKIDKNRENKLIETVPGFGYRIRDPNKED